MSLGCGACELFFKTIGNSITLKGDGQMLCWGGVGVCGGVKSGKLENRPQQQTLMSDFRNELEKWINAGLDERVHEALAFCWLPPASEQVKFLQQLQDWMIFEKMCQKGLRKSVDFYLTQAPMLDPNELLWAVELCAQTNSPSLVEILNWMEYCTADVAESLYQNHPLVWLKHRHQFDAEIQNQAKTFFVHTDPSNPSAKDSLWECFTLAAEFPSVSVDRAVSSGQPLVVWAAVANALEIYKQIPLDNAQTFWRELGQVFLEWPAPYKNGDNKTLDTVMSLLRDHRVEDYRGKVGALQVVLEEHFQRHGPIGLRQLVHRFGERGTIKLLQTNKINLIWKIEQNPAVVDGLTTIADWLHKTNVQSLAASDICYSVLPYTSRSYRAGLNVHLRRCAKETLGERVSQRRSLLKHQRATNKLSV